MLLLDEDQVFEKDLPKKDAIKANKKDQLLSEIAEEDDISSHVSESVRNPYGIGSNVKNGQSSFGPGGKSSVTSVKSVQSTSKLSSSHTHKQSFTHGGDIIDKKRRSEIMQPKNPPNFVGDASISSGSINSQELVIEDPFAPKSGGDDPKGSPGNN